MEATHTPSIAFQQLPPNSARFSYTTEGALFISFQLSIEPTDDLLLQGHWGKEDAVVEVEVLFYVNRNCRFIRDGEPRMSTLTSHSF